MSSLIKIENLFCLQYFGRLREGLKKMISINFVENRKGVILAADICNGILWNLKVETGQTVQGALQRGESSL